MILCLLLFLTVHAGALPKETGAQNMFKVQNISGPKPWTHLRIDSNSNPFTFAVVSDRHGGARKGVFESAIEKLNTLEPAFVLCIGDLVGGHSNDTSALENQFIEFDNLIKPLKMPFFYVPGNHDLSNTMQKKIRERKHGPSYYHFVYRDNLFLCLNSEDPFYGGIGGKEQMDYIKTTLADNRNVKWTYLFIHRPLWHYETIFDSAGLYENAAKETPKDGAQGWLELKELLKSRKYTFFSGHEHAYRCDTINGMLHYTLATTGGGSLLRGVDFGEFDHFAWVKMGGDKPEIANIDHSNGGLGVLCAGGRGAIEYKTGSFRGSADPELHPFRPNCGFIGK